MNLENIYDSRIVVIDDSPVDLKLIRAILEKNRYTGISTFTDPAKAMVDILSSVPDLVIIDLFLGDITALDVIQKLKTNSKTRYLPIVIISSSEDEGLVIQSLEKGADDFISKKKNAMEIQIRVTNVLKREYYRKSMEYKQKQLEEDIRSAAKMQERILTSRMPEVPGYRFDVFYLPYHIASGDFYKAVRLDRDRIFFVLSDVSGHGVGATLLVFHLDNLIQEYLRGRGNGGPDFMISETVSAGPEQNQAELSAMAVYINGKLEAEYGRMGLFITALMGFMDLKERKIHYISAGSPPPLIEMGGQVREVAQKSSPPLGVVRVSQYPINTVSMDFERMLIFSDGIIEVADPQTQKMLNTGGLAEVARGLIEEKRFTLNNLYTRIAREYHFNFEDDLTIMMIEKKREV